jgi:hypothetical protein
MKKLLYIALLVPSFIGAMQPQQKSIKYDFRKNMTKEVGVTALTYAPMCCATILPFPTPLSSIALGIAKIYVGTLIMDKMTEKVTLTSNLEDDK